VIHGERATPFDIAAVYATGLIFGVIAVLFAWSRVAGLSWWRSLLLFVVAADVGAGVVAVLSSSTDRFYAERPGLRWIFIFAHIVHPAALFALFGGRLGWWAFLYAYTASAASIVNVVSERSRQEVLAGGLVAVGVLITLPLGLDMPFLAWFGPVYMLKLILAFAVRRT
jgi:hypothetical protein